MHIHSTAIGIIAVQVMLGAQPRRVRLSVCLPELAEGTEKFSSLVLFTQSSLGGDQSRTGDGDAAGSQTELSPASSMGCF